jgi:hypothetical protein
MFFRSDFIWGRESVYGVRGEWWVGRWWWPYRLAGPPYHFPNGLKGKGGKGNDFGGYENSTVYLCVSLFTFLICERVGVRHDMEMCAGLLTDARDRRRAGWMDRMCV